MTCVTRGSAGTVAVVLCLVILQPLLSEFIDPPTTPPIRVPGNPFGGNDSGSHLLKNEVYLVNGVPHRGTVPVKVSKDQGVMPDLTYDVLEENVEDDGSLPVLSDEKTDRRSKFDSQRIGLGVMKQRKKTNVNTTAVSTLKANLRRKRGIVIDDETRFWTNGIVPYVFSAELSNSDKLAIMYAMEFISNISCIRFVPWDSTTQEKYGLQNNGHLRFVDGDGCWSHLGNNYAYFLDGGQPISCCYASVCIHELGHALGLRHEHAHYANKGWLRRNWFNQTSDWLHAYAERQPGSDHRFTPYDLSSPMHYKIYSYTTEMTLLFPDMEMQVKYHYFAKLIADTYRCKERNCSSFRMECLNNGFVTLVKGECSCVCVDGLDPTAGCFTQRTKFVAQTFPGGNYAILAPSEGCPSANGFQSGVITHTYNHGRVNPPNRLLGTIVDGVVSTQFCVRQSQYQNAARWPRGAYCIYKVGACPAGFYESSITIGTNNNGNTKSGTTPEADLNANDVRFYYCCRRDGIITEPVDLPNTKPFALVEQSPWGCQQVKGMGVFENYYSVIDPQTTNAYQVTPDGPRIYRSTSTQETYFYYCYYYPVSDNAFSVPACTDTSGTCPSQADGGQCADPAVRSACPYSCNACPGPQQGSGSCTDTADDCDPAACASYASAQLDGCHFTCRQCPEFCGGIITLTDTARSRNITSPNYPLNYGNNIDCFWQIKGPSNSFMLVKFNDFDVEGQSDTCKDKLQINNALMGHKGINYCGQGMYMTIRSITNVIEMRLQTDFQNARRGFSATVSLVMPEDHCYDQATLGQKYRGKVSHTRDFKACLPWNEVAHCRHSAFTPDDLLDGLDKNYCRNPGDGLQPWCYYDADGCKRNYCDVCSLETPYDTEEGCGAFKDAGNCANETEARSKCARTCQDQLPATQTTVYTDIQCTSPPTIPPDGTPTQPLQGPYNQGDKITFTCNESPSFSRVTTCLTDGSWSPVGYACGGCAEGWTYYRGYCYQEQPEYMNYYDSKARCHSLGGDMVEPRDEATMRFLVMFKDDGHSQWMGLERVESMGYRWQDGTKPTWTAWGASATAGKDCAELRPDVFWTTSDCFSEALFVCRLRASAPSVCADLLTDCASKISDNTKVCDDQPDFAKLLCPKSCYGDCNDPCSTSPCQNGGTCEVKNGSYVCHCTYPYAGSNCETQKVEEGDGDCVDTGDDCEFSAAQGGCIGDKKHYVLSVCQQTCSFCDYNSSTCVDKSTSCPQWANDNDPPQCSANPTYMLSNCKKSCGHCDGEGCVDQQSNCYQLASEGQCSDGAILAVCPHACGVCFNPLCPDRNEQCHYWASVGECDKNPAYMHTNCPYSCGKCREYYACYGEPCQNGGNCTTDSSTATGYTCTCVPGFVGDNCEATDGGACESSPCQNEGTCNEVADAYTCSCEYGYTGANCEAEDPCAPNPCQNGGTCSGNAMEETVTCSCASGFAGETCEATVCTDKNSNCNTWANVWIPSECERNPAYMHYNCPVSCGTCASVNPCWANRSPCQNGGTCKQDAGGDTYTCTCTSDFQGDNCEDPKPAAMCAAGWVESNGACYKFVELKATFTVAEINCKQNMNSQLTTIKSKDERDFVRTLTGTTIWIGGDKRNTADFVWFDGTLVSDSFTSWKTGEPDGVAGTLSDVSCMIMNKVGNWLDFSCSERKKPYVCRYLLS